MYWTLAFLSLTWLCSAIRKCHRVYFCKRCCYRIDWTARVSPSCKKHLGRPRPNKTILKMHQELIENTPEHNLTMGGLDQAQISRRKVRDTFRQEWAKSAANMRRTTQEGKPTVVSSLFRQHRAPLYYKARVKMYSRGQCPGL